MSAQERQLIEGALPAYELGVELGRGAWGVVFDGRHRSLGRQVAIKQLPRAFAADPNVRERFGLEARTAADLDHPHIVKVFDFVDREDGMCLIVMERMQGTLSDRFHSDGLATDETTAAGLATCAGLAHAHARNILHRDIKPENLLYDSGGVLKVGDFGIARALDSATRLTATGTVIGTPAYMSPEQASGEDLTPASDVYSVGIMLYELLSGGLPFTGEVASIGALIRQHLTGTPVPLLERNPQVPSTIAEVIDQSINKEPGDRFDGAESFGVALAEASVRAFGSGWLRQRRFVLNAAPEIVAATEKDFGAGGRAGTVVVRGAPKPASRQPSSNPTVAPQPGAATPPPVPPGGSTAAPPPPPPPAPPQRPPGGAAPPSGPPTGPPSGPPSGPPTGPPAGQTFAGHLGDTDDGDDDKKSKIPVPMLALAGIAVVLLLVAGAVFVLGGGDDDDPVATDDVTTTTAEDTDTTEAGDETTPTTAAPGVAGADGEFVIGTVLSDDDFDAADLVAIDLAVSEINEAGGVLGQPMRRLPEKYSPRDAPELIESDADVIIGPGDPLDAEDLVTATEGEHLVISYADAFDRPFGTQQRYVRTHPGRDVPIAAILDKLPETGTVIVAAGDTFGSDEPGQPLATVLEARGYTPMIIAQGDDEDEEAWGARIGAAGVPAALVISDFLGQEPFYRAIFAGGITPQNTTWIELDLSPGASGMEDGELQGVTALSINVLAGLRLQERVPASDFNADAAQAYDAVILAALAAEAAGSATEADIAAGLSAASRDGEKCTSYEDCLLLAQAGTDFDYDGVSGPIDFGPDGTPGLLLVNHKVIGESTFRLAVDDVELWPSDAQAAGDR